MVTKILDFIHIHPNKKLVKSFFYYLDRFSRYLAETDKKLQFFAIEKFGIDFFSFFFKTKVCNLVSNINDDCSQLSFEVYNVFVAQKLKILENSKHFFHVWTLATSATSRGLNFDLSNLNKVSNFS